MTSARCVEGQSGGAVQYGRQRHTAAAYYMSPSMEALLVTFNTIGQPLIYRPQNGVQPATLDGFPIHWIGVSQPYATTAAPSTFFGVLWRPWLLVPRRTWTDTPGNQS